VGTAERANRSSCGTVLVKGPSVAIIESVATRNGRTLKYRVAEIHALQDGRIAERWAYSDDTAAIVEFFA
jgi:ketosteroid isomerase-like protein